MRQTVLPIGHNNFVPSDKVVAIFSRNTRAVKPMISKAELNHRLIKATFGKGVKSVILTSDNYVVLSSISPKTLADRYSEETQLPIFSCGGGNHIPNSQVAAILQKEKDSEPITKLLKDARANDLVINAQMGKPAKCIILTSAGYLIMSFLSPQTIAKKRFEQP
ncbi:DUF370 domain-containing protein [Priestia filamentosa]|uniref:DUF370 domain-containing protein n=1 Tax=Priestia filamentosa TaxID=1402861 RepID=UPI003978D26E